MRKFIAPCKYSDAVEIYTYENDETSGYEIEVNNENNSMWMRLVNTGNGYVIQEYCQETKELENEYRIDYHIMNFICTALKLAKDKTRKPTKTWELKV
jgi:ABC-type lipoprotein release transport system permease subunit